ncbi:MAG: hybrid sensor histidine kinase/response regulator [Beijerinckiaceae bacterium]
MRLYFTEYASSARFGVRPLQAAAFAGAIIIGAVLWHLCGTPIVNIAIWCFSILLGETAIAVINHLFLIRQPSDADLPAWAKAKAVIAWLGAFAYSFGQVLLHVDGQPLTTLVPPWTIMMYCCGAVWAGAFYAPALTGMIVASCLPAGIWLLTGSGIQFPAGLCLLIAMPFFLFVGRAASLRYRMAVNDKLDIEWLLEKQRADSQRIAQLSAERARFFSAASHDLRQPLHAMGLYLALLRDSARSEERDELIENLLQCAGSLDTQFNAILGVNDADKLIEQARPAPTPLQQVLDRIAVQARPQALAAGLKLREVGTGAWALVAPEILDRVVSNLVANALRYTKSGGVLIGARRRGREVAIAVVDTGVGIAPEHRQAIFQDFFQVSNQERNSARGFGLGLAIVRRYCAAMNWRIELKSTPGRGTAFLVFLPAAEPVRKPQAQVAPEQAPSRVNARRALVVDDDERVLDAMRRMFERWNVEADFCRTPEEALEILSARAPDTKWRLLADFRLGAAMTGLDLAQEAHRRCGDRLAPAIVTGETDEKLEARAEALGIAILRKPVQPVRLRALLAS